MTWMKKNQLLLLLFGIGACSFGVAAYLFQQQTSVDQKTELARSFLSLAMTVVLGGFIKLIFDENVKRSAEIARKRDLRHQLLNRLRKVFDDVDSARLLIRAHKSAKTYGEQIREKVIVAIPVLYDVKRSLADSTDLFTKDTTDHLRLSLHYMIAYLSAITDEYATGYLDISNTQFFQEAVKEKTKKVFQEALPPNLKDLNTIRYQDLVEPDVPGFAWKKISELVAFSDFDSATPTSLYNTIFIAHYEYSKSLLKGAERSDMTTIPSTLNKDYLKHFSATGASPDVDLVALIKSNLRFRDLTVAH